MNQEKSISPANFREYLDRELSQRNSLNPNYSLRAFARDLGVDSSFLSKLLNGKRSMTARTILTLAPRLSLMEEQVQAFISGANGRRRRFAFNEESTLVVVPLADVCENLDWSHLALLSMFELKDFSAELPLLARRLGCAEEKVELLLKDLESMKLITNDENGFRRTDSSHYSLFTHQHPQVQVIKKQIWDQAVAAMSTEEPGQHLAMTFAVSESRLEEVNARIKKFRLELAEFMNAEDSKDNVYQLAISLFPAIRK